MDRFEEIKKVVDECRDLNAGSYTMNKTKDALEYCVDEVERCHTKIAQLENANKWRPLSESPKKDGMYLVVSTEALGMFRPSTTVSFYSKKDGWQKESVSKWMPLPKP